MFQCLYMTVAITAAQVRDRNLVLGTQMPIMPGSNHHGPLRIFLVLMLTHFPELFPNVTLFHQPKGAKSP